MWTRAEIKARAKVSLKRNYLPCIFAGIVLLFAMGSMDTVNVMTDTGLTNEEWMQIQALEVQRTFLLGPTQVIWNKIILALGGLATVATLALRVFVFNPIEAGGCRFFLENAEDTPVFQRIFCMFKSEYYLNVVKVLVLRDVFIYLWGLLFIIPGIYKSYEYYTIPYQLSENPALNWRDAFQISKEMMYGEKWNAFVLELSFILWDMLSMLTFGLSGIFYSKPYYHGTVAELYLVLKRNYWDRRASGPDVYAYQTGVY